MSDGIREDDDGCADFDQSFELQYIFVFETDTALSSTGAYGLGQMGAVYTYIYESRHIQAEKPRTVCTGYRTLAVLEVVLEALGVQELVDFELTLRGFVVTALQFRTIESRAGYIILFEKFCPLYVFEGETVLADNDIRLSPELLCV